MLFTFCPLPLVSVPLRLTGVVPLKARATASATRTAKPMPDSAAAQRCPRRVSISESEESRPTSISRNKNRIMIAPV